MRPIVLNFLYPRKHHTKYLLDSIANCFSNTKGSKWSKRASVSRAWAAKWGWYCHTSHPQTFPSEPKEKSSQPEASGGLLSHSTGENQWSFLSMKWKISLVGESTHDLSFFFLWIFKTQESSAEPALHLAPAIEQQDKVKTRERHWTMWQQPGHTPWTYCLSLVILTDQRMLQVCLFPVSANDRGSVLLAVFSMTQCVAVDLWLRLLGLHGLATLIPFLPEASLGKSPVPPHAHCLLLFRNKLSRCQGLEPRFAFQGKAGYPSGSMSHTNSPKPPRSLLDCLEM